MMKNQKGITLATLVITIVVIFIVASIGISKTDNRSQINDLKRLNVDIELLNDKVLNYYLKYNELPLGEKYTNINDFEKYAEDTDEDDYYEINLSAMDNITLNYGKKKTEGDIYIINTKSFTIYYVNGIIKEDKTYYFLHNNQNRINTNVVPTNPEIKVVSGEKDEDGKYIMPVALEIIPGKDKFSGVKNTTYSINGEIETDITELENNIYIINTSSTSPVNITVKTYNNNNLCSESTLNIEVNINNSN